MNDMLRTKLKDSEHTLTKFVYGAMYEDHIIQICKSPAMLD